MRFGLPKSGYGFFGAVALKGLEPGGVSGGRGAVWFAEVGSWFFAAVALKGMEPGDVSGECGTA